MSIAEQIARIKSKRDVIINKLESMGLMQRFFVGSWGLEQSFDSSYVMEDENDYPEDITTTENDDGTTTFNVAYDMTKDQPCVLRFDIPDDVNIFFNGDDSTAFKIACDYNDDATLEYEFTGEDFDSNCMKFFKGDFAQDDGQCFLFVVFDPKVFFNAFKITIGFVRDDNTIDRCATTMANIPVYTNRDEGLIVEEDGLGADIDVEPGYHRMYATRRLNYPANDELINELENQVDNLETQVNNLEAQLEAVETELSNL